MFYIITIWLFCYFISMVILNKRMVIIAEVMVRENAKGTTTRYVMIGLVLAIVLWPLFFGGWIRQRLNVRT